jgi:hypothetical protein
MIRRSFQQSAILSMTITLTFCSLSISESTVNFLNIAAKGHLRGKVDSGLSYSGILDITGKNYLRPQQITLGHVINIISQFLSSIKRRRQSLEINLKH